jgi:glycosyltransferase involved in cell wall biosynthesis
MKISIITPSYNQARFIERTIKSVLNQDYNDFEYIIIDGGSTDGTIEILKKYSDKINWKSEKDNGQTNAINKGLKIATGEIVAYLNSDDTYKTNALSAVADFFQKNHDIKWVTGKCKIINANDKEIRKLITLYKNLFLKKYSFPKLLSENFISQPATFWRRELHEEFGYLNEAEYYAMDYDFWVRIGKKYPAGIINKYLANFRYYSNSKTGKINCKEYLDALRIAEKFRKEYRYSIFLHKINYFKIIIAYKLLSIIKL